MELWWSHRGSYNCWQPLPYTEIRTRAKHLMRIELKRDPHAAPEGVNLDTGLDSSVLFAKTFEVGELDNC